MHEAQEIGKVDCFVFGILLRLHDAPRPIQADDLHEMFFIDRTHVLPAGPFREAGPVESMIRAAVRMYHIFTQALLTDDADLRARHLAAERYTVCCCGSLTAGLILRIGEEFQELAAKYISGGTKEEVGVGQRIKSRSGSDRN